jgi:hypothetical protein
MNQTLLMAREFNLILRLARKIQKPSIQVRNETAISSFEIDFNLSFTESVACSVAGTGRSPSVPGLSSSRSRFSDRSGNELRTLSRSLDASDEISSDDEPSANILPRYAPLMT